MRGMIEGFDRFDLKRELTNKVSRIASIDNAAVRFDGITGQVQSYLNTTDYPSFEDDGTLVFNGLSSVYDDLSCPAIVRVTGANRPTLAAMVGNIRQYQYAINDWGEVEATELLHSWKEGTMIQIHAHWATGSLNGTSIKGVRWKIEYSWANTLNNGGTTAFALATTASAQSTIAIAEPALTHRLTVITTFTPTGGKIGAYMSSITITRIASLGTTTPPATNPFLLAVGIHYQKDTVGSRTISAK